jgi:hypothetical protein
MKAENGISRSKKSILQPSYNVQKQISSANLPNKKLIL